MKRISIQTLTATLLLLGSQPHADACTGITLTSQDQSIVLARTIEWGGSRLNSACVIVPRGHRLTRLLPNNYTVDTPSPEKGIAATYGFIGLSVERPEFIAEGLNEAGLSAGLFYFPAYGKYEAFRPELADKSVADLQLVSYLLASCATVDEAKQLVNNIHVVALDPRGSTIHWRIADRTGRQVVLEIIDEKVHFYDNPLGVLTNAPSFPWHLTNLNNYVNLHPGSAASQTLSGNTNKAKDMRDSLRLSPLGSGSGFLGLPGDITPPSRFVRAAFYQSTAPHLSTATKTIQQAFHLLNNFDIPLGIEFSPGETLPDMPSATQWTTASDLTNGVIYYRTMDNPTIRSLPVKKHDWAKAKYEVRALEDK